MSKLTIADWAKQSDAVVFGHCKPKEHAPYQQAELLFKEIGMTTEGHVNVYVVADDAESRVLSAELSHLAEIDPSLVKPIIYDYTSLLHQLRNPGASKWWEQACVTIVAQIDLHYSAPFALSILELVKWAASPTSKTRLRVLTLSAFDEPEESIKRSLKCFAPNLTVSLVESVSPVDRRAAPTRLLWTDPDSMEEAVKLITEQVRLKRASIVLCHPEEALDITATLSKRKVQAFHIYNVDHFVDSWLDMRTNVINEEGAPVLCFCIETSHIPMEMNNLGAIVVSRRRRALLWEYGRIVRKPEQTSRWEVDQAVSYSWQTSTPKVGITILEPETSKLRKLPRRRLDNDQAISFLVEASVNFDGMDMRDIIACFVTDYVIAHSNRTQLGLMKCVRSCENGFSIQACAGQELMVALLPKFQYQFLPAWFLAIGVTLPRVTVSAKRAMIRLAAIVHQGVDFIDRSSVFWQQLPHSGIVERLQILAYKIAMQFEMPRELLKQGGLWAALAAWHSASITMDGFRNSAKSKHIYHDIVDVANDTGIVLIRPAFAKRIGDLVDELEDFLGIGPQDKKLVLDENDCKGIQTAMVQTWMHRIVTIAKMPADDNGAYVTRATDMVSMDVTLSPSGSDLVPIGAVMGSRGTADNVMILAALSLERGLRLRTGVLFGTCVVLPIEHIREWQVENDSRNLFADIRCAHPLVTEPEA